MGGAASTASSPLGPTASRPPTPGTTPGNAGTEERAEDGEKDPDAEGVREEEEDGDTGARRGPGTTMRRRTEGGGIIVEFLFYLQLLENWVS